MASGSVETSPPRMRLGREVEAMTRRIETGSLTQGSLSQVCAELRPSAWAMQIERITASSLRSLMIRPPSHCEMKGSIMAFRPRSDRESMALALASRVAALAGSA